MSRIDTALKPRVENKSSAALRMASRMFGFLVTRLLSALDFCTFVQSIKSSQQISGWARSGLSRLHLNNEGARMRRIIVAFLLIAGWFVADGADVTIAANAEARQILAPSGVLRALYGRVERF